MPRGRMLNKKIVQDEKVAKLSIEATLLYTWCIAFLDKRGRIYADLWTLKSIIPHISEITPRKIPYIIKEWVEADLVNYYGSENQKYLEFKGFTKNQSINEDREAESEIPNPIQSNSGVTPDQVNANTIQVNTIQVNTKMSLFDFQSLWLKYPNRVGKAAAERHFKVSVKTGQDWKDINTALENYLKSQRVKKGYIQNGSTWFNNWRDWIKMPEEEKQSYEDLRKEFNLK